MIDSRQIHSDPGDSRAKQAHLPGLPGGPEIFALCPGCAVHPDGGIFPASALAGAEGCPAGPRLAAQLAEARTLAGGEERRRAEREGSARAGSVERKALSRCSPPATFSADAESPRRIDFSLTALGQLCSGGLEALGAALALPPRRLLAAGGRRLRRRWYFHRRQAICRQRLSRIVSDPSWIS